MSPRDRSCHIIEFGGAMAPRPTRLHRTRTGIDIGGGHTRPPPMPSADAERIQAALLLRARSCRRPRRRLQPAAALRRALRALRAWLAALAPLGGREGAQR